MAYLRWVFSDGVTTATMPVNPETQSDLYADRSITGKRTTNGTLILSEGERPAAIMQFSGAIIHKAHYDLLNAWAHGALSQKVVTITDHFGRAIQGVFMSFNPSSPPRAKPAAGKAWYHTYDCSFMVISIGNATRGDNWEPI
jgi:hypothetical protein